MRCMRINQRPFWYASYEGTKPYVNEQGFETGEEEVLYGKPVRALASISPASDQVVSQMFGVTEPYDAIMLIDDPKFPLDEYSRLWLGDNPDGPHTHVVKRVSRSLNHVAYAIRKVDVSDY